MVTDLRLIPTDRPVDLARTLFPLRRGTGDPTMRIGVDQAWRACRTPEGPATIHLWMDPDGHGVRARAWGPGRVWALDRAPGLAGLRDDDRDFRPTHDVIRRLHHRLPGVRLTRTDLLVEVAIPAILEQKVTGTEARRSYRRLVRTLGEPAPDPGLPGGEGLLLPPDPAAVASLPSHAFHPLGVERRRAEVIRTLCANAPAVESLTSLPAPEVRERLTAYPGIGPWTAAEVTRPALADADAVSVGDYHLPHLVAWNLAGEPRASDERMLELLEPYRGHRGRVQRLLEAGGDHAPRYGPRMPVRAIERI